MTEKRSDYRKKSQQKQTNSFLKTITAAFKDDDSMADNDSDQVDINPAFMRSNSAGQMKEQAPSSTRAKVAQNQNHRQHNSAAATGGGYHFNEQKAMRLKSRLNRAILLVLVLIVLVLLALFYL